MQCEIVDFFRPKESNRKLFVANLPLLSDDFDTKNFLHKTFSKFGIIYQISVIAGTAPSAPSEASSKSYGFVIFYSTQAAATAIKELSGRLWLQGQLLTVKYAKKFNSKDDERKELFYAKCFELANFYLGFNGWNLERYKSETNDLSDTNGNQGRQIFKTVVKLTVHAANLHAFGSGISQATFKMADVDPVKSGNICKQRKLSYQSAVQNAFSKLVLVVLNNGKVHPEINTTLEETLDDEPFLDMHNLLQVNNIDSDPEEDVELDDDDLDVLLGLLEESSQD